MTRGEVVRDYGGVSAADRRAGRRRRLLDAARTLWGDAGLDGITVRGVCSASGLTPRYFYEHFVNREALVVAVADEVRAELIAVLVDSSLDEAGSLEDKLRAALTALLELVAGEPTVLRIMSTDFTRVPGLENRNQETMDQVAELVLEHGRGFTGADLPAGADPRHVARFVVGGVWNLIEPWLHGGAESPQDLADLCTRLSMNAVRMHPTAGR